MEGKQTLRILTAAVLVVGILAWRYLVVGPASAIWYESHLGYFVVLAAVCWTLWESMKAGRPLWPARHAVLRAHWIGLLVVVVCALFLHVHEPHRFKVLFDEPSHVAGSWMMHTSRMAVVPAKVHLVSGGLVDMVVFPGVRLYLFQFLLSVFHDLFGYRSANVFWLNGLVGLALLTQVYALGARLVDRRAGIAAVLLLAGLPLLAQAVTSGSYDVLNLALIAALVLATQRYLSLEGDEGLNLMVSVSVLLALSRYESIAYTIIPVAAYGVKWLQGRRPGLSWASCLSPLLVMPSFAANSIMMGFGGVFTDAEQRVKTGAQYFDIRYLPSRVHDTFVYLFSFDLDSTNSLLLSLLGTGAGICMVVGVARRLVLARKETNACDWTLLLVSAMSVGLLGVAFTQYWSSPLDPLASRFTLPLHLVFVLGVLWLAKDLLRGRRFPGWAIVLPAGFLAFVAVPMNARHSATSGMLSGTSHDWFIEYARKHPNPYALYASSSAHPMLIERLPSVQIGMLNDNPVKALQVIRAGIYDEIIVHEVVMRDVAGREVPGHEEGRQLAPSFVVDVLTEHRFGPDWLTRIVRIVGVRQADGTIMDAKNCPMPEGAKVTGDRRSRAYLDLLP